MLEVRKVSKFSLKLWPGIICLFILLLAGSAYAQQAVSRPGGRRIVFTIVEQPPKFAGGSEALAKYLSDNLKYPDSAGKKFRSKTIFTGFIITETGLIDSVRILRPVNELVDAEVVRVIKNMPAWIPGKQRGHEVSVRFNFPVHFPEK